MVEKHYNDLKYVGAKRQCKNAAFLTQFTVILLECMFLSRVITFFSTITVQ